MNAPLLSVQDLIVNYGDVAALRGVDLSANTGEVVGIVGESGCGKSTLAAALIGLLPSGADASGAVSLDGRDILALSERDKRAVRGNEIAMIFQDPMTAFNPVLTIGEQLCDFQHRSTISHREKHNRAETMLARVGIADPALSLRRYPHQLSGGMQQRAAVAAALLMAPKVLVADEPTTALDVTMEAQILHLLRDLRTEVNGAIIVITHHLGVIGELCDRVYVMYAGQVVEDALVDDIYHNPRHPYTRALIGCDPAHLAQKTAHLPTIPGRPPDLSLRLEGCAFAPRCPLADDVCRTQCPPRVQVSQHQSVLCHKANP
jgi:oligopeptide/dipeptide ABC transporter ATP-binding protein